MSKKIRKGDVVLAKDLTEDYWGSEIEFEQGQGVKSSMVLKKHHAVYVGELTNLYPEGGEYCYFITVPFDSEVTITTPPWAHHPEKPTEVGTIIQIEGEPAYTYVVDYYGDILNLLSAKHVPWDDVKRNADDKGAKILVFKPAASYNDGLTDIETSSDWDPSKEELYRTRQWEDRDEDIWSFRDGEWGYFRGEDHLRVEDHLRFDSGAPWSFAPLRLVPKDEEVS